MMNVLADLHHADLWWSLDILFQKRLGWKLYRPYGMAWYDEGYYKLYGDLRRRDPERYLAKQYLVDTIYYYNGETGIGRETMNGCIDYPRFNFLTLDQARKTPIDIVLCSVNENESYFARLREFWPKAKFIRHVGNQLDTNVNADLYPNLLASALEPYKVFPGHKVLYRQEFDLNLFRYVPPSHFGNIYSFQNDLEHWEETWDCWLRLRHNLREFTFKSWGVGCEDGKIYSKREYVQRMLEASFTFQIKKNDGYGHVIHNAFALGRPIITRIADYVGTIAEPLLIEGGTYLEADDGIEEKVRYWARPENLRQMSERVYQRFGEVVNFERDFAEVKKFLEELV